MIRFSVLLIMVTLMIMPASVHAGQYPETAPSFTLLDSSGKSVNIDGFKGKIVFLVFWAAWCAPCREELPELDRLYKKYNHEGFEVIAVSVDASESDVKNFLQKFPVSFPVLLDKRGSVNDAYRVSGLPIGFLIGKNGIIRHIHRGFGKEFLPMYEKEIEDMLK